MPPRLLIIADDLTGANDTGVQFARQGIETLVSLWPEQDFQTLASACQVLVVNTESRHISPSSAFQRVYDVAAKARNLHIPQFYKKTDSTLRGNIGSELAAMLAATDERELFFAPAYPKLQRTTRAGVHYVNGVPLHQSAFACDSLNPLRSASIATIIAQQTTVQVSSFAMSAACANADTIFVVDAETDEDLQRVAGQLSRKKLLAGSAGLAEFLPEALGLAMNPVVAPSLAAPLLVVNGSLHEASLSQVEYARTHGWTVFDVTPELTTAQVVSALQQQQRIVLTTVPDPRNDQFAERMARLVSQLRQEVSLATVVVFGGDTLAAIAAACGWTAFRPCAEFQPGLPLVQVCGVDDLLLLTKAGGFGDLDLLSRFPRIQG